MAIYALGDVEPDIHPDAFVHPDATIIGDVRIGAEASVWPGAVLRGDSGTIEVGPRTSIQDGSVIHATHELPTVIGADCVVGHMVHVEGCTIEDGALVGNGSIVLHRAVVRTGAVVGSNAVVPNGMEVPAGSMALGVPATIKEGSADRLAAGIRQGAAHYVENGRRYKRDLRRLS